MFRKTEKFVLILVLIFVSGFVISQFSAISNTAQKWVGEEKKKKNVILIDIDRLNQDRLPCFGYKRNTTPHICKFADKNIKFTQAVSQAGHTPGSTASIFTSQYPTVHNVVNHQSSLKEEYVTLAEILRDNDYNTAAFPSLPEKAAPYLHEGYNLNQGFDNYVKGGYSLKDNTEDFMKWFNRDKEPFFAFVQGFDPHRYIHFETWLKNTYRSEKLPKNTEDIVQSNISGYGVTDIVVENNSYYLKHDNKQFDLAEEDIKHVENRYDDALKRADNNFGSLIKFLKEKGIYSDSYIVLYANHGEMLDSRTFSNKDRRFGHGVVWEDDIHVPLIIHTPKNHNLTIDRQVELIDLLPTLLEENSIKLEDNNREKVQGQSLKPLYDKNQPGTSYTKERAYTTAILLQKKAVRNRSWKYVESKKGRKFLYNLKKDPNETKNVYRKHPNVSSTLKLDLKRQELQNQKLESKILE